MTKLRCYLRTVLLIAIGLFWFPVAWANLSDGLVAYYPFDGNAQDESGNGNHGTVHGATLTENRFGNTESAYVFDGINDSISVDDGSQFNFINNLSVSLWVNPSLSQSNNAGLIDKSHTHNSNNGIQKSWAIQQAVDHTNFFRLNYQYNNTDYWSDFATVWLEPNVWNHILVSKENETVKYYKNGTLVSIYNGSVSSIDINGNLPLIIGAVNNWDRFFNGSIDDIRIYNRALSKSEIQQLYQMDNKPSDNCWAIYEKGSLHIPCIKVKGPFGDDLHFEGDMQYEPLSEPMTFQVTGVKPK